MFFPVSEWFGAFLLTIAVEIPVVVLVLRRQGIGIARLALLVVIANLATHPAVWFVFTQLLEPGTTAYVLVAETWAVVVEAVCYGVAIVGLRPWLAVVAALAANGASWLAGWVLGAGWLDLVG